MGVLDDKVAIVTGSARGIGRATAELLAEHGANVVINDLDADVAEQTASEIDARLNSCVRSAGTRTLFSASTAGDSASHRASIWIGDSLNRKLFTGRAIAPFSIRNTPSRVSPVTRIVCGSSQRMYQNRVIKTPRATPLISSSRGVVPPPRLQPAGWPVAGLPCFWAQNRP